MMEKIMKNFDSAVLILGIWIFLSPWLLDFSGINLAVWSNVIVGTLMIIFSIWRIFDKKIE